MAGQDNPGARNRAGCTVAEAAREGCPDSRLLLSRRSMIGVTTSLFSSAFLPKFAHAATDPDARLLVVVLRGGMDGMSMVVPKLDPLYASLRGQLAVPSASTLSLGADFGLHPGLSRVHGMFAAGDAAFAPAAGIPLRNRSHFKCQDNLENGLPINAANATGWLNRLLGGLPAGDPIRVNRGIEIGEPPLILRGPEPVLGWSPTWFEKARAENLVSLRTVYSALDPYLWQAIVGGVTADRMASAAGPAADGISELRKGFIGAARLMRAAAGPRIAVLSVDNWDTHADQGVLTGQFNDRVRELDAALGDLKTELGTVWSKTVAICVTEFGRTVRANGSRGTDHGIASAAILVGGAVRSGLVGDWPGLAPAQLFDGDLRPSVDLRAAFKGILRDHLGVPTTTLEATVFPGSAAAPPIANLVKTPVAASSATRASASASPPSALQDMTPIERYRRQFGAI